jgi:hypothetical protein
MAPPNPPHNDNTEPPDADRWRATEAAAAELRGRHDLLPTTMNQAQLVRAARRELDELQTRLEQATKPERPLIQRQVDGVMQRLGAAMDRLAALDLAMDDDTRSAYLRALDAMDGND